MGRKIREFNLGYSYHITTRCNNRDFHLAKRENREILLHIIKKAKEKYSFKVYALCIMLNHVHYLIEAEQPEEIPKIMHYINWYSAMTFNTILKRKGHFWEARYTCHGFKNEDRQRALNTIRYIHANPVAAGMRYSFFYEFSNYGSYEKLTDDGITQWHPAFLELGESLQECSQKYRGFCRRYTPKKKKSSFNSWGRKLLKSLLAKTNSKPKPKARGQYLLPFYQRELVFIDIPIIKETAMRFIKANQFSHG